MPESKKRNVLALARQSRDRAYLWASEQAQEIARLRQELADAYGIIAGLMGMQTSNGRTEPETLRVHREMYERRLRKMKTSGGGRS